MEHVVGQINSEKVDCLALHGFLGNGQDFDFLKAHSDLSRVKFYTPDLFSSRPEGQSLSEEAQALASKFLPEMTSKQRTVLVYSYGGRVALEIALQNPACFGKLILVSTSFGLVSKENRLERAELDEVWAKRFETLQWLELLKLWSSQEILSSQGDREWPGPRDENLYNRGRLTEALRLRGQAQTPFYLSQLSQIKIPVLLVAGEADAKYCALAKTAFEQFPNVQMRIVKGAGHRACFEKPESFAQIVKDFIF